MLSRKHHKHSRKTARNSVKVRQSATASTGQGGNAFAINASDDGVLRTDINPR